jgi:flagellar hook protein FlgE
MSILSSLYIGTSGMTADSGAIGVVGDNIANVNTVGYKRNRADFADVLGGTLGEDRLGAGVRLGGTDTNFEQGAIQQTGNPLDLAIRGNGFFEVKGTHDGETSSYFTRDGRMHLDSQGYVVNNGGLRLQGYLMDSAGVQGISATDMQLAGKTSPAVASTSATMSLNLDSSATPPVAAWDPANPQGTSNYSTSMTVYDSLGSAHKVDVFMRAQGGGNWEWHAMADGGDLAGGTKGSPTEIASGSLSFTTSGQLQSQTTNSSSADFVNAQPGQVISFNFGDDLTAGGTGLGGTTQFSGTSSVTSTNVDGHAAGQLVDVAVNQDGTVEGTFDNGEKRTLARVALALFGSNDGLRRAGDGLFEQTSKSGQPLLDAAGTGGRGAISGGATESSNVDLGSELVTMIAYQRSFQGNARTITTADEMLTEVANLKR